MAIGKMGMSLADFLVLTPLEFNAVAEAYRVESESLYRASWEQARFVAYAAVAPHTKKVRRPQSLMRFPWEEPASKLSAGSNQLSADSRQAGESRMTKDEVRKRVDDLVKRWG